MCFSTSLKRVKMVILKPKLGRFFLPNIRANKSPFVFQQKFKWIMSEKKDEAKMINVFSFFFPKFDNWVKNVVFQGFFIVK